MPETSTILTWVAVGLAVYFLGLPLLILGVLKMRLDTGPIEVDSVKLKPMDLTFLGKAEADLQAIGYIAVGRFSAGDMVPNVDTAFSMLVHPDGHHAVMAVVMKPQNGDSKHYVEFASETEDGREINTSNSSELTAVGEPATKQTLRMPWLADLTRLEKLHRLHVADVAGNAPLHPVPLDLPPGEFLREELREELQEKSERGLWREVKDHVYQPTIKGAYLMTWGELWPIKPVRRARDTKWAKDKQESLEAGN